MHVELATTHSQIEAAATLFREYAETLPASAQLSLAHQGFESELAGLPGKYAPPQGCILLAVHGSAAIGVVAMRPLDPSGIRAEDPTPVCEMKRMYVRPTARGLGAGKALAVELLSRARACGYRMMKLDTEPDFVPAVSLYRSLGFVDIPRYNDDPVSCTLWMGVRL
ncbi:MAG TPA: GNAT family N-acetyltransferase [Phycisphaerales bacterium]|nr:GNAT family N-acetyltransferase [Phycisphaerales bacterium]